VGAKRLLVGKGMSRRSWALAFGSGFADRVLSCIEDVRMTGGSRIRFASRPAVTAAARVRRSD
jgi:hypothetical protein